MTAKTKKISSIWIERLGISDLLLLLLQNILSRRLLYYDEHCVSLCAQKVLRMLENLRLCNFFIPANLSLEKKDDQGFALVYQLNKNAQFCCEAFCDAYAPKSSKATKVKLMKYLSLYVYERITFITMIEAKSEFRENNGANTIYLSRHHLNGVIRSFYANKDYIFAQSFPNIEFFKYFIRPLYLLFRMFLAGFSFKKTEARIGLDKNAIWVEYAHPLHIDLAFWRGAVNTVDYDVIYYADRDDDPPIAIIADAVEKIGLKCIDLHFPALLKLSGLTMQDKLCLCWYLLSSGGRSSFWFKVFQFEDAMWFLLYKRVFEKFKVKIVIQRQEFSFVQASQAEAIEASGGIMIGFHWSSYVSYNFPIIYPMQVLFVWGKIMYDCYKKKEGSSGYVLPSGLWLVSDWNEEKEIRNFSKRFDFTMCIFDGTTGYNVYQSPETFIQFYNEVLGLLEANLSWGGVVKSKVVQSTDFLLSSIKPMGISERVNALIAQKRLFMLDPKMYPSDASRYADVSVCYGLNSAGVVSGVYGHRFIQWDSTGCLYHPFYKDDHQKIAFTDLNAFKHAIIQISKGDKEIGDFASWRKKFNYFEDFLAADRVGKFMQAYMEGASRGDNPKHLLSCIVADYIREYRIGEDFFCAENLWETIN